MVRGKYGKTPVKISDEIRKKIIGSEQPITNRPADLIPPALAKMEEEMIQYKEQEEDVLSYALFPQIAVEFFKFRQAQKYGIDPSLGNTSKNVYPI